MPRDKLKLKSTSAKTERLLIYKKSVRVFVRKVIGSDPDKPTDFILLLKWYLRFNLQSI